jgi:L-2-hydroxyglutarate oxidase LhgO
MIVDSGLEDVEAVVIGAGVIGLAIARKLALAGKEVFVLECAETIGTETSSRNSEVIHAGIYYPRGSLMARFCVDGKHKLYDYCAAHGVDFNRCGKLIVATGPDEVEKLAEIQARAKANGVDDIRFIGSAEALALEPALSCHGALLSPSTGILDSHGYMLALQGDAENAGAVFAFNAAVTSGEITDKGIVVEADGVRLRCKYLVNSAGLHAPDVARRIVGQPREKIPESYYAKGEYFVLSGRSPFSRLIYPVPQPGGLGVHLTIDLAGEARFGPDVQWIDTIDYTTDISRSSSFYEAVRRYWPDLRDGALKPGYAGIRPKIVPPHVAKQDFVVSGPADHGIEGLVNLFGIESPGLTASLAIADHVAACIG